MGETVPGLGDDDVVEGRVGFAEAGEADFDDHWGGRGERVGRVVGGLGIGWAV